MKSVLYKNRYLWRFKSLAPTVHGWFVRTQKYIGGVVYGIYTIERA